MTRASRPASGLECEVLGTDVLQGRICLVTGAGSGIGRAIALRLLALGATVTGVGRHLDSLTETGALASGLSGRFRAMEGDVRDIAGITALVEEVGRPEGLDLLVNNAGGQFYAPATKISRRGWDSVIDLNLSAIFTITQAAFAPLRQRAGAVVNISLTGVDRGMMGGAHTLAARAGVLALTRSLALEWAPYGIRLNCIGPGVVVTPALKAAASDALDDFVKGVPLGRATEASEVAELVAFLASAAGRMITGQLLQIDGGAHIGPGLHPVGPGGD